MRHSRVAVVSAAGLLAAGAWAIPAQAATDQDSSAQVCIVPKVAVPRPADPAQWSSWVDQRIEELQPTTQERQIDRIGWSRTILDAQRLSRQSSRPVFLFTHDGRISTGRC